MGELLRCHLVAVLRITFKANARQHFPLDHVVFVIVLGVNRFVLRHNVFRFRPLDCDLCTIALSPHAQCVDSAVNPGGDVIVHGSILLLKHVALQRV